jgi:hypothetical protein
VGWWREGDSPFANHKHWSPSCGFIKGFVVGNIPIDQPEIALLWVPPPPHYPGNRKLRHLNLKSEADCRKTFEGWSVPFIDKNRLPAARTHSRDVCGSFMEVRPNSRPEQGKKTYLYSFLCGGL